MGINRGKEFEYKFQQDWKKVFPNTFILRLPDQLSGMKGSTNPCDFICFNNGFLYVLELKSHKGASVPFDAISQYDKLLKYKDLDLVVTGVIIWLMEKDEVFFVPIEVLKELKDKGEKSVGIRHFNNYNIIKIPSIKKRVFMDSDYSIILDWAREKYGR